MFHVCPFLVESVNLIVTETFRPEQIFALFCVSLTIIFCPDASDSEHVTGAVSALGCCDPAQRQPDPMIMERMTKPIMIIFGFSIVSNPCQILTFYQVLFSPNKK
jgi:hypothetical protein